MEPPLKAQIFEQLVPTVFWEDLEPLELRLSYRREGPRVRLEGGISISGSDLCSQCPYLP